MNRFKWYRTLRGGYWVYWHFIGWSKVDKTAYNALTSDRFNSWSTESYV